MADYYATIRSNYFKVKNKDAWKIFLRRWELEELEADKKGLVGFTPSSLNDKGTIESPPDDEDADFAKEVSQQLADGEVAIWMEVGNEKLRYVHGHAFAVNSKGKYKTVNLSDIYERATKLTDNPKKITYCEY